MGPAVFWLLVALAAGAVAAGFLASGIAWRHAARAPDRRAPGRRAVILGLGTLALTVLAARVVARARSGVDPTGDAPGKGKTERGAAPDDERLLQQALRLPPPVSPLMVTDTRQVALLTGPGSPNRTDSRWNVFGTDLGHMFTHDGRTYLVFGDTFGGPDGQAWRSNTMAWVEGIDRLDQGLDFSGMIEGEDGGARELLGSLKISGVEKTVIPTYGASVDGRMLLHNMSVRRWLEAGQWEVNGAGIAFSDDDGATWTRAEEPVWGEHSNFVQAAFVEDDGYMYMFGIPAGRLGGVALARVDRQQMLHADSYRYWDGDGWARREQDAVLLVAGPVGELSVGFSSRHDLWVMLTFDEHRAGIVLRTAPRMTGPWSDAALVTSAADHPQLYAPYLVPGQPDGDDVYFTMSRYDTYEVYLMHTTLRPTEA